SCGIKRSDDSQDAHACADRSRERPASKPVSNEAFPLESHEAFYQAMPPERVEKDLTIRCLVGQCLAAVPASSPAWAAQIPSWDADRLHPAKGLCMLRSKVLLDISHEASPSQAAPAHT